MARSLRPQLPIPGEQHFSVGALRDLDEIPTELGSHAKDRSILDPPMTVATLVTEIIRTGFMSRTQRSELHRLLETGSFTPQETRVVRRLIYGILSRRVEIEMTI